MSDDDDTTWITERLRDLELVQPDAVVVGWVLCFETIDGTGVKTAGFVNGPHDMSSWRAMGLLEYIKDIFRTTPNE